MALQYRVNEEAVSHNDFDGEVVVIDFKTGNYYSMRNSAASIWCALSEGAKSPMELSEMFTDPPTEAVDEIGRFLNSLAERRMVVEVETPAPAVAPCMAKLVYQTPVLEAFEDLQALLVADVIHDVDEQGWPNLVTGPSA